jgi:GNAT superfamily N-acetyltransferase
MSPDYIIRSGRDDDASHLPAIEHAAGQLFTALGWSDETLTVISVEEHRAYLAAGRLWVAADAAGRPVGFAVVSIVDGRGHLDEIDVHPDHGRRGLGRALVERVCRWAADCDLPAVTLTTERDIPWNAPFYARLGFAILAPDELGDGLRAILAREAAAGLDPATRVAMIRHL